jgi:hypothetical protein
MLTENPRTLAALAGALGLVLFGLGFGVGWLTDDSSRPLAQAVPLAASPEAVAIRRPARAEALPDLRPAPRRRRPPRTTPTTPTTPTTQAAPKRARKKTTPVAVARPPRPRPAPKPVTIVGTG